jgi:hypothetical protein
MSNVISVVIGILCAVLMCVALIPLLGWLNWLVLAGCVFGIIFGAFGEKKTGLTINAAVAAVGMLRLLLGGGVL